jgi:hypothetical protein
VARKAIVCASIDLTRPRKSVERTKCASAAAAAAAAAAVRFVLRRRLVTTVFRRERRLSKAKHRFARGNDREPNRGPVIGAE